MCQVAAVTARHYLAQVDRAVDAFLDRGALARGRALPVFHLPVVLEKGHVVGGGLDAKYLAELVVHLDRGIAEAMLDAGPLDPGGELRARLLRQLRSDLAAEKGGDLFGLHTQHRLPGELFIERPERGDGTERRIPVAYSTCIRLQW